MKKTISLIAVLMLFTLQLVSAQNMQVYMEEEDETSIIYDVEINLNQGWNLVSGLINDEQIDSNSEVTKDDIKAIYFYSNIDNKYIITYPIESEEFTKYINDDRDICGDGVCSADERVYFETWCSSDCQGELSEDIMNHLNVIAKERLILRKDEHQSVGPPSFKQHSFETYWDKTSLSGTCESRGYGNVDCMMLHHDIDYEGTFNSREFINSPNDGNPYNDRFGKAFPIGNDYKVYAQVDYTSTPDVYEVTFYELDDSTLKLRSEKKIPTFYEQFMSQANWVYTEKAGTLKYRAVIIKLNNRNLKKGWNFLSITPDMVDVDLENLKGNCDIQKTYFYNSFESKWVSFRLEDDFEPGMEGLGAVMEVSESCNLGTEEDDVNEAIIPPPPSIP